MEDKPKIGRWCALCGPNASYADEVAAAVVVASTASGDHEQIDITIRDPLPGWETPLWGADRDWLYLRRPEGVWKTRLPKIPQRAEVLLCVRDPNTQEEYKSTMLGGDLSPTNGWRRWRGQPASPATMDATLRPAGIESLPFDEAGCPLLGVVERKGAAAWLDAGDAFCSPPIARRVGRWIVATDCKTGRRVGFGLPSPSEAELALDHGELWLRFSGDLLAPVDCRVME